MYKLLLNLILHHFPFTISSWWIRALHRIVGPFATHGFSTQQIDYNRGHCIGQICCNWIPNSFWRLCECLLSRFILHLPYSSRMKTIYDGERWTPYYGDIWIKKIVSALTKPTPPSSTVMFSLQVSNGISDTSTCLEIRGLPYLQREKKKILKQSIQLKIIGRSSYRISDVFKDSKLYHF